MLDKITNTTLVLIGAISQIIIAVLFLLAGIVSSVGTALGSFYGGFSDPLEFIWVLIPGLPLIVFGILGLLFGFSWLRWRHTPTIYKRRFVMTGIFALIFTGIIPGLLVLIGGAITTEETT